LLTNGSKVEECKWAAGFTISEFNLDKNIRLPDFKFIYVLRWPCILSNI
jgi:hypothetical protein